MFEKFRNMFGHPEQQAEQGDITSQIAALDEAIRTLENGAEIGGWLPEDASRLKELQAQREALVGGSEE